MFWLVTPAQAQVEEATKVATDSANLLLQYQVLGVFCIFLIFALLGCLYVINKLYNSKETLNDKVSGISEKALITIEASTAALVESRRTDQIAANSVDNLGKAVSELSHQNEKQDTEVRHGLGNASLALTGLMNKLGSVCDKLDKLYEKVQQGGPARP